MSWRVWLIGIRLGCGFGPIFSALVTGSTTRVFHSARRLLPVDVNLDREPALQKSGSRIHGSSRRPPQVVHWGQLNSPGLEKVAGTSARGGVTM